MNKIKIPRIIFKSKTELSYSFFNMHGGIHSCKIDREKKWYVNTNVLSKYINYFHIEIIKIVDSI